jgi:hypothetical protein
VCFEKVGHDDNMWDAEDAKDGSCAADTANQEVLMCSCGITQIRKTLLFGGFQPVDFILPVFDETTTAATTTTTTTTLTSIITTTAASSSSNTPHSTETQPSLNPSFT